MGKITNQEDSSTRQRLLHAALKCFAEHGYAGTSVQQIVDAAGLAKPALYYYFEDKSKIFESVVDSAHDERYQLMQAAAARGSSSEEKLTEILADVFEYARRNRELMRLTFATAFANTGDEPGCSACREKGRRNFDFIKSLVIAGQQSGELDPSVEAAELAMGIYGQLNSYVMISLLVPDRPLNREAAEHIVQLFLRGAMNRAGETKAPAKTEGSFRRRSQAGAAQLR